MRVPTFAVAAGVSLSAALVLRVLRKAALRQQLLEQWAKVSLIPHDTVQFNIRLPEEPDAALAGIDSLSTLKERIESLGLPPLLPRDMHCLPASVFCRARRWLRPTAVFKMMQFNLLAEGLSSGPDLIPPFPATERSGYGGFDAVAQPELVFDWDTRKLRLIEEILRCSPDLLTVQECDHFYDTMLPALRLAGYDGVYAPKNDSPCGDFGYYSDGSAIFWRTSAFERLGAERLGMEPDGRPFVLVLLRHVARGRTLLCCTTHMKAKSNQQNEDKRARQTTQLLDTLQQRGAPLADGVLLCGDFNADPYDTPPKLSARCVPAVLRHPLGLRSAYPLPDDETSPWWTTWKKRGDKEIRHTIDYIFHDVGLSAVRVLAPPDEADLEPARLPGLRYPSDHLSIVAELEILS